MPDGGLRPDGSPRSSHPGFSGFEELERVLEECGELVLWLESRGFDLRELLEDGEELLDNALLLYYLLEDVADGSCRVADVWRGGSASACRDMEAMYFECTHGTAEGYTERYGRVAVRMGSHVITVEVLKPAGAT
jgi:NTP pyrophosphatase (non-canonical NTP hydrolase)